MILLETSSESGSFGELAVEETNRQVKVSHLALLCENMLYLNKSVTVYFYFPAE